MKKIKGLHILILFLALFSSLSLCSAAYLSPYLITNNITVNESQSFTFIAGVTCVGGSCGNVTATLDPEAYYTSNSEEKEFVRVITKIEPRKNFFDFLKKILGKAVYSPSSFSMHYSLLGSAKTKKVEKPFGKFQRIEIDGLYFAASPGQPFLPIKPIRFVLPPGSSLKQISVKLSNPQTIALEEKVEPAGNFYPLVESPKRKESSIQLGKEYEMEIFPFENISQPNIQKWHSFIVVDAIVYPVKYFPKENKIVFYRDFVVEIQTEQFLSKQQIKITEKDKEEVRKNIDNPEILSYYRQAENLAPLPSLNYDYVIIANQSFINVTKQGNITHTLEDLAEWKRNKGMSVKIVSVQEIVSNSSFFCEGTYGDSMYGDPCNLSSHNDTAAKIRNFIRFAYSNWNTRYVLLVGDADRASGSPELTNTIPVRCLWASTYECNPPCISSDLYYSNLDGSFDYDNDGIFGEPNDGLNGRDVDLYSEVAVGRIPADSPEEVSNFVRKVLDYEFNPSDPYFRKAVMAGEYLGFGGDSEYATQSLEEIRLGSCNHGYCTAGFPEQFEVSTLYDAPNYSWPKSELISKINSGIHIIHHLGHANPYHDMKLSPADLNNFTNLQYYIGYSQGCYPADFDERGVEAYGQCNQNLTSDSIGESFVSRERGAVAFIGNTRYGFGRAYSTDGPSQWYHRQFQDALFGENISRLGDAHNDERHDNVWRVGEGVARFVLYEITLFGDPALDIPLTVIKSKIPMSKGRPFHTILPNIQNPVFPENLSCLRNMQSGQSCNVTWNVNATYPGEHVLFVTFESSSNLSNVTEFARVRVRDTTAPVLSDIASRVSKDGVTIMWETDDWSNSTVFYGNSSQNLNRKVEDSRLVLFHEVILDIEEEGIYYYKVKSCNADGLCSESSVYNFTTPHLFRNCTINQPTTIKDKAYVYITCTLLSVENVLKIENVSLIEGEENLIISPQGTLVVNKSTFKISCEDSSCEFSNYGNLSVINSSIDLGQINSLVTYNNSNTSFKHSAITIGDVIGALIMKNGSIEILNSSFTGNVFFENAKIRLINTSMRAEFYIYSPKDVNSYIVSLNITNLTQTFLTQEDVAKNSLGLDVDLVNSKLRAGVLLEGYFWQGKVTNVSLQIKNSELFEIYNAGAGNLVIINGTIYNSTIETITDKFGGDVRTQNIYSFKKPYSKVGVGVSGYHRYDGYVILSGGIRNWIGAEADRYYPIYVVNKSVPVRNANVTIKRQGIIVASGITDSNGFIELGVRFNGTTYNVPHHVDVNGKTYMIDLNFTTSTAPDGLIIDVSYNPPPSIRLNYPPHGLRTNNTTIIFDCSAEDNEEVKNLSLYTTLSGSWRKEYTQACTGKSCALSYRKDNLPEGVYMYNCLAYDNEGKSAWSDQNYTFMIYTTPSPPPFVLLVSPPNNYYSNQTNVTLKCNATGSLTKLDMFSDVNGSWRSIGSAICGSSSCKDISYEKKMNVSNGTYIWNCRATDNLSREGWHPMNYTFTIGVSQDTTPPVISIISPVNASYNTRNIWANVSLNEPGSWCGYSLDGSLNVSMTKISTTYFARLMENLAESQHSLRFYCNDTQGNMGSALVYFTVNMSAPSFCGNGACEANETQQNCCLDCGCPVGYECQNNACIPAGGSGGAGGAGGAGGGGGGGEGLMIVCNEQEKRCFGKELQKCINNSWITIEYCNYSCINNSCVMQACEEGKKRCQDNKLMECKNNVWIAIQECEICDEDLLKCISCIKNEKKCSEDGKKLLTCINGEWSLEECKHGCDAVKLECKQEEKWSLLTSLLIVIGVVILIIIIIILTERKKHEESSLLP
ncbi:MAG: C25 family cysteine peptidase [Candidatus Pacearchaeota archaeon]